MLYPVPIYEIESNGSCQDPLDSLACLLFTGAGVPESGIIWLFATSSVETAYRFSQRSHFLLICFSPDHFVYDSNIALNDTDNLIGNVGIHIIRNRDPQIAVLNHLNSQIH